MWVWKTENQKKILLKQFLSTQKKIPNYTLKFKALKEAFKIFDKNRNGYIEAKELKAVTTTLGQALSDDEFSEFWQEADANADGKLDYEEFIKMMLQYWCFWFLYQKKNHQKKINFSTSKSKWCYSIDLMKHIYQDIIIVWVQFEIIIFFCTVSWFAVFLH